MSLGPLARVGLRVKITIAVAAAMALLFGALGLFTYVRFQQDLDGSLDRALRARAEDVRALVMQADSGLRQAGRNSLLAPGERFAEVIGENGAVLDATPSLPRRALLPAAALARASVRPTLIARTRVAGVTGSARVLAIPVRAQGQRMVVIVGSSLRERDQALADLRTVLLLGGPVALLVASLLGYAATTLALRSVESMRRRAQTISVAEPGQRLPVPRANDELGRLARTLNAMLGRDEAAFERERRFVADASHELRSPLAILKAELDVALVGESSRGELESALRSAAEEADRLSGLAEALLTLADTDRERPALQREWIDVGACLQRLSEQFSGRAQAAGAVIVRSAPGGLKMWADRMRVEQALGNLVDNALRQGAREVLMTGRRPGASVELRVSDDGPGFPAEFIHAAFERFSRADTGRSSGGAGLGLSIVRGLARAHGGDAHVCNRSKGGALVWLSIPDPAPQDRAARRPVRAGTRA